MRRLCVLLTSSVLLLPRLFRAMSFRRVLRRARRLCMTHFLMLRRVSPLRTRRFRSALLYAQLFRATRFHLPVLFSARLFNTSRFHSALFYARLLSTRRFRSALFYARPLRARRFHRPALFSARLLRSTRFRSAFVYPRLFQPSLRLTRSLLARRLG